MKQRKKKKTFKEWENEQVLMGQIRKLQNGVRWIKAGERWNYQQ